MKQADTGARMTLASILLLVFSCILIGGGAILPGISGGVLCVIFGIYRPMMELLAHPKTAFPKYWRTLLPVGVGWLLGFIVFAKILEVVFQASATIATCAVVGLIAGTIPSLWKQAGAQGRGKGSIISCAVAFVALFSVLLWVRTSPFAQVTPNMGWFLFAGVLWGISFIVPGMTSSSILMSLGLLQPLAAGVASFDWAVIIPWLIGMVAVVLALAKLVDSLFKKQYAICFHAVVGVVIASTLVVVPVQYASLSEGLFSILGFAVGFAVAWLMSRLDSKLSPEALTGSGDASENAAAPASNPGDSNSGNG